MQFLTLKSFRIAARCYYRIFLSLIMSRFETLLLLAQAWEIFGIQLYQLYLKLQIMCGKAWYKKWLDDCLSNFKWNAWQIIVRIWSKTLKLFEWIMAHLYPNIKGKRAQVSGMQSLNLWPSFQLPLHLLDGQWLLTFPKRDVHYDGSHLKMMEEQMSSITLWNISETSGRSG